MARVAPISLQQSFWNGWNASNRERSVDEVSRRQAEVVCEWLSSLGRKDLEIIDVGCGAGWLCPQLTRFGRVTGTDLSDEVLARARERLPGVTFVAGDFMDLDFGARSFDVIVSLEVLSHVADQRAFLNKLASHLRPRSYLMLATQNRVVLQCLNLIPPPAPGQLRRWVDRRELQELLEENFEIMKIFSVTPKVGRGLGIKKLANSLRLAGLRPSGPGERDRTVRTSAEKIGAARPRRWLTGRLEAVGLGWTLMALARKRASA
jgi:2-polyprenyl-3-methyl-5-hydroxy-6-metoxy-1,4-benzoquinol methylase